jgi:hypothetical protein
MSILTEGQDGKLWSWVRGGGELRYRLVYGEYPPRSFPGVEMKNSLLPFSLVL